MASPAALQPRKVIPCYHFKQGFCPRGEACLFLHRRIPCPNPSACPLGNRCPYTHPKEAAPTRLVAGDTPFVVSGTSAEPDGDRSKYLTVPCLFFKQGKCTKGEACTFIHEIIPCKFGTQCTRGLQCPYHHPSDPPAASATSSGEQKPATDLPETSSGGKKLFRTVPCFNFKHGHCVNGSSCSFLHERVNCKFGAFCPKGLLCPYDHPKNASEQLLSVPTTVEKKIGFAALSKDVGPSVATPVSTKIHSAPCFNFKLGKCINGANCTFLHERIPCRYGAGCPKQLVCPYIHPQEGDESVKDSAGDKGEREAMLQSDTPLPSDPGTRSKFRSAPCFNYKLEKCINGSSCKFLHERIPCKFGAACPKPLVCAYVHPGEGENSCGKNEPEPMAVAVLGTTRGNFRTAPCFNFKHGKCINGTSCTFLHEFLPCQFGASCPKPLVCAYVHPDECGGHSDSPGLDGTNNAPEPKPEPELIAGRGNLRTIPCLHYRLGTCTRGEACTFLHALLPCKFGSECRRGAALCPFVHDENDVPLPVRSAKVSLRASPYISPIRRPPLAGSASVPLRIQPPRSALPCMQFKRGSCPKGSSCSFLHQLLPCKDGVLCPNQEQCPYVHTCA
eukprot:RCo015322